MKKVILNLCLSLRNTLLELVIIFLIIHTSIFNVIDILPRLYQFDITQIRKNINAVINLVDTFLITNCYATDFFSPPDKAVNEGFKGGNSSQSFQTDLFTGKAGFNYHIDVVPGRKGIQPNLNLIYSSQSNNGWCGVGWTLDLGSIYRSTKKGIPKYDTSDVFIFSINGSESELVSIGSNEYRTKTESDFMKFYFDGNNWEITDKTGIKYRLGCDSGSKIINSKGIYKWCLDKVIDVFGNYMLVSYTQDQGQLYLSQIKYTGNENTGDTPHFIVDFILESRQDLAPNYRTGDKVVTAYRIKEVQTKVDTDLAKKYILSYVDSSDSKRSLLSSITRYGSDGATSLPPATFTYKENGSSITPGSNWLSGFAGSSWPIIGDFNGDGLTDVGLHYYNSRVSIAASNDAGFNNPSDWLIYNHDWSNQPGFSWNCYPGDFNGDGITDIVGLATWLYRPYGLPHYWLYHVRYDVCTSNGNSFNPLSVWLSEQQIPFFGFGRGLLVGDFNGDGLSDLGILINYGNTSNLQQAIRIYFSTGSQFIDGGYGIDNFYISNDKILLGDFNGDSLTDVAKFNNGIWSVALSTGNGFISFSDWLSGFGSGIIPLTLDINGDGLTDAVTFDSNTGQWKVAISDGIKFVPANDWINNFGSGKVPLAGDFNGDSIAGPGFIDSNSDNWQVAATQGTPNDLLTQINNGIGGSTTITYAPSPHNTNSPYILQTVKSVITNDGLGNSYVTNYQFSGALYDRQDKEFRGFNYVRVTDAEGNYTETYFHQDDLYKGRPYLQQTKDSSGNIYTKQENIWSYRETNPDVNLVYLKQQNTFTYDGDSTFKKARTDYEYDNYGNIKRTHSYGDVDVTGDEKDVYAEYVYNTNNWILSLPSHAYVLDSQGEKVQEKWFYYDGHINLTDPPTKGLLTKEELWLNTGTQNPITTHTYDTSFGNPISTTDAEGHTSSISYDSSYHIYPVTLTNALLQNTRYTFDSKIGQILTITDANNQIANNIYDTIGRLIKIIGPNDTTDLPNTIYEYDLSTCPIKLTKKSKINALGEYLITHSFSDGLGRLIQTKSPSEDDPVTHFTRQIVSEIAKYDQRGQIREKYLPYFVTDSANYSAPNYSGPKVTFDYDPLGRSTKVTNPDGTCATVNFSDWVMTKTDENNHIKTEYYDAFDRLIKVEEHNQGQTYTTIYDYDAQDNLIEVTDNQNNITKIGYDSLGRKTKMDDPDMGIWLYEYDKASNLTKQTDAKGSIINFQYDALNRLQKKDYPAGTGVSYIYDEISKPNCIGRLSKFIDASGSTEFFYDNLGREIKTIKTVDGAPFAIECTYDSYNRTVTQKYPNGEIVNYTYNNAGNIKAISGASNYVVNINYNATNQIVRIEYGNGTYSDYTYNPQTLRISDILTNGGVLQNLSYTFDNVGNIKGIVDRVNTGTQSFIYDDLDRLTNASGSYGSLSYQYDPTGNMINKEGVNYSYGQLGKKPHAVTSGNNGFNAVYDDNGNMVNKNNTTLTYDYDNRLTKVESATLNNEIEMSFDLRPGWNFISFPVIPSSTNITSVFSNLTFGVDYDQISRYNTQLSKFEHFVNNTAFDDFTSIEYGKGYQIYITNPLGCTLIVKGHLPQQTENVNLFTGWNLVFSPYLIEKPVVDAFTPLVVGTDYNQLSRYNNLLQEFEHFRNSPEDTMHSIKPTEGYFLYCLKNASWSLPSQESVTTFVYDAKGDRVKKIADSETTIYIDSFFEKNDTTTTNHIFLGQNRIASVESGGNTYYYHQDHLGSSNIITDEDGNRIQLLEYTPFGTTWVNQGQDLAKYKFTGKELDKTGLYYFGSRYHDPEIGRFIQPDSYIQDPSDPQSFNRYSYCCNNPLTYVDPSGNFWAPVFIAILSIISIVSVVVANVVAMETGSQTWSNTAMISGTGITATIGNASTTSIASQSNTLAAADSPTITLDTIVVRRPSQVTANRNALIAQQAAEAARQSFVASVVGGITNTVNSFIDTGTITGSLSLMKGADYSTFRGWVEGGVGLIGYSATCVDAGFNILSFGGKGTISTGIKNFTKLEGHHLLPKEFKGYFRNAGLNIEKYIKQLSVAQHRLNPGGIHTNAGGNWNKVWKEFIKGNPEKHAIIDQLKSMMREFGI